MGILNHSRLVGALKQVIVMGTDSAENQVLGL